eukprot:CAMPEP_0203688038 /NCGR_PEP_ID=MMETSP0091-20130426/891_1 /ASSEMBLY_ACC=CAM_ASM_001089 /TAXON_ID=426623 /ORGANISM="Chaetoceros affinis, Strain CCMP159" /LENGTH=116 /DNA_ID=CAMNT_0050557489 /DNA_START=60 /DNA_END=411 /DNA_ORIENTATION=+
MSDAVNEDDLILAVPYAALIVRYYLTVHAFLVLERSDFAASTARSVVSLGRHVFRAAVVDQSVNAMDALVSILSFSAAVWSAPLPSLVTRKSQLPSLHVVSPSSQVVDAAQNRLKS